MTDPSLALYKVHPNYKESLDLVLELLEDSGIAKDHLGISVFKPPAYNDCVQISQNNQIIILLIDILNKLEEQNRLLEDKVNFLSNKVLKLEAVADTL